MRTHAVDFFKSKIEMVKSGEVHTVAAYFNCSEFKEAVIEAVFENRKIGTVAICNRFCKSKNYAAAVA